MNKTQTYPLWEINIIGNYENALKIFKLFKWKVTFISHVCRFTYYDEIYCKTDICLN